MYICPLNRRRGFNLIEAAIVLGVIGLVIGGIWVAAAAVTENRRKGQMYAATIATVEFFSSTFRAGGRQLPSGLVFWNDVVRANIALDGFTYVNNATGFIGPWGGSSAALSLFSVDIMGSRQAQLMLRMPQSACLDFVRKIRSARLSQLSVTRMSKGTSMLIHDFEQGWVSDAQLNTFCGGFDNMTIFFENL
jgi:hypothetical protein